MGNTDARSNEIDIREVDRGNNDTVTERGSNSSGSSTTTTSERGTGRGNTSGSGRDGRGSTETKQKEEVSGLSILDEKEKKRLERNEKRRQRYQEQKAKGELPSQKKPKKVNAKKKKQDDAAIDTNQLNIIIKTISTLIASRPNCSHWMLSDAEIESITTPLTKMMQESDLFNKLGEHSNQIALVTACVTVFVPRIIQTTMIVKENKKRVREVRKQSNQGKIIELNRQDDRQDRNADDGKNNGIDEHWTSSLIY